MITSAQCRAARALLKWSQEELAKRSGVGVATIRTFETDASSPYRRTLNTVQQTFEDAGIEFLSEGRSPKPGGGQGVRLRR